MITYDISPFGLRLLFTLHGSAVYRATVYGFLSVGVLLLLRLLWYENTPSAADQLGHPYAIGILVAGVTFLLIFRAQSGYARYWEAAGATHQMMSKWMDAVTHTAAYHLQCSHYDKIKPPSYFDYHELNARFMTRDRENRESMSSSADSLLSDRVKERAVSKSIEEVDGVDHKSRYYQTKASTRHYQMQRSHAMSSGLSDRSAILGEPRPLQGRARLDGNWGQLFDDNTSTYVNPKQTKSRDPTGFASHQGGRTPALFLQELAHLASLLVAVAFSTLRNDMEGSESPLGVYEPGSPWPVVDPEMDKDLFYHHQGWESWWYKFRNFLGTGRSPEERTRHNASRPIPVIGGISEGEIRFLQMARGPYAKTQLCWYWLSEFIIREHLAGSTGKVGPPIISRIIQFLSDGMIFYNHSRKIMFIPFPFPHAQLTAVYVLVMVPAVAFLMDQYTDDLWLGCILTFLTVTVLTGIHEVARELENPFRNVPNELPLVTFMAQYNEALLTMFSGYHPDAFWADTAEHVLKQSRDGEGGQENGTGVSVSSDSQDTGDDASVAALREQIRLLTEKVAEQGEELHKLRDSPDDKNQ